MIEPTEKDIGRSVIYTRPKGLHGKTTETGVITLFNRFYVFVRYGSDKHSKATRREDLQWELELVNNLTE